MVEGNFSSLGRVKKISRRLPAVRIDDCFYSAAFRSRLLILEVGEAITLLMTRACQTLLSACACLSVVNMLLSLLSLSCIRLFFTICCYF